MQLIWLFRRMRLFPFRAVSNSAYLNCAPSPNAPIFITCILLQRLLAPSLVMLSFITVNSPAALQERSGKKMLLGKNPVRQRKPKF
jgi:hypothetical protein